jgi:tetratricopeptide (TPR) repeat protein
LKEYNEHLIDENLKLGEFWHVIIYLFSFISLKINQGDLKESHILLQKLNAIGDTYEYGFAKVMYVLLKIGMYNQTGKFYDCLHECDEGISFCKQLGLEPYLIAILSNKARAQIYLKDKEGAKKTLSFVDELVKKQGFVPRTIKLHYLRGQQLYDLQLLEEAVNKDDKLLMPKCRKRAYHSCKKEIKNLKNHTISSIFSLNLFSRYFWLIDQQGKALKLWKKAIDRAKDFGVEGPDLARTYMEIGRRLLEKKSKFKELDGIKAEEYLEKAREMFERMDMQWCLDELERITAA